MTQNGASQHEPRRSGEVRRVAQDTQGNNPDDPGTVEPESDASSNDEPDARRCSFEDIMIEKDERTVSSSSPYRAATDINANLANDTFMTTNPPLKFIQKRSKRKGRQYYISDSHNNLRNSLLALVGFLELANAGDFAANVFNEIPVPTFAAVLMGIGGCVALSFCAVAIWDARLSYQNIQVLKRERRALLSLRRHVQQTTTTNVAPSSQHHQQSSASTEKSSPRSSWTPSHHLAVSVYLDVNIFETRTELVDRLLMDLTMGFGALLVGVGTLMAIAGANPRIFEASNLLSGYIGNGPAALYGLLRAMWSAYVYLRTMRHQRAVRRSTTATTLTPEITQALNRRYARLKFYAFLAGPTSLVAGAASLVTATRWWGYTMLAPCIFLSWVCNTLYRKEIGYTRPILQFPGAFDDEEEQQGGQLDLVVAVDSVIANMNEQVLLTELNEAVGMRKSFEFAKKHAKGTKQKKKDARNRTTSEGNATMAVLPISSIIPPASPSTTFKLLTKLNLVETFFLHLVSLLSSSPNGSEEQRWAQRALLLGVSSTVDESTSISESRPSPRLRNASLSHQKDHQDHQRDHQDHQRDHQDHQRDHQRGSLSRPPPTQDTRSDLEQESELEQGSTEQESPPPSPPFRELETTPNARRIESDSTHQNTPNTSIESAHQTTNTNINANANNNDDDDDDHDKDKDTLPPTITIHDPHHVLATTLLSIVPQQDTTTQSQSQSQHRQQYQHFLTLANSTLSTHGLLYAKYRERYTIEYLGCLLHRRIGNRLIKKRK